MREKLPKYLTRANCWISLVIWLPAWIRMVQLHSARDYSLLSLLLILWLQASNLLVAILDKSKNLTLYLIVNTATVTFTVLMVAYYQRMH